MRKKKKNACLNCLLSSIIVCISLERFALDTKNKRKDKMDKLLEQAQASYRKFKETTNPKEREKLYYEVMCLNAQLFHREFEFEGAVMTPSAKAEGFSR